jgi:hypothetical protein
VSPATGVNFFYKSSTATQYTFLDTDRIAPYEIIWANVPPGTYNVVAQAYDTAGNSKYTASTVSVR